MIAPKSKLVGNAHSTLAKILSEVPEGGVRLGPELILPSRSAAGGCAAETPAFDALLGF